MAHAQICPICHGIGKYCGYPCHGCGGRGWIEVRDEHHPKPNPYDPRPRTMKVIWI